MDATLGCLGLSALQDMKDKGHLCDATLHSSDGGHFRIHRAIMASCSPYFRALFITGLNGDGDRSDVTIPGISASVLNLIVEWTYSRARPPLTWDSVQNVLPAADQFNILQLIGECCQFFIERLSPQNCIGLYKFGCSNSCAPLARAALRFFHHNFRFVSSKSDELLHLPLDDLVFMLSADELDERHEEFVLQAGLRWIEFAPRDRLKYTYDILCCVRLGLMTRTEFDQVASDAYIKDNPKCQQLLEDAMQFIRPVGKIFATEKIITTPTFGYPRLSRDLLLVHGGWGGESALSTVFTYDCRADMWMQLPGHSPEPRSYHQSAVIGCKLYVFGGYDGSDYLSSCSCYDISARQWSEVAPMNRKRAFLATASQGAAIYAIGGFDGDFQTNGVERYDTCDNQWFMLPPMLYERSDSSATCLGRFIYVVGGYDGFEHLKSFERFDPVSEQWTALAPMDSVRCACACVAYMDTVFVMGGYDGGRRLKSCERYHPSNATWSPASDMYNQRSSFTATVMDNLLYVVGGVNSLSILQQVECFDRESARWYLTTPIPIPLCGHTAGMVRDLPNRHRLLPEERINLMEEKRLQLQKIYRRVGHHQHPLSHGR